MTHPPRNNDWRTTWQAFTRALQSPEPFDPFAWILRLFQAAVNDTLATVGCCQNNLRWRQSIVPMIPIFAILLIVFCALSYPLSLRKVIQSRWCCPLQNDCLEEQQQQQQQPCSWMILHDCLVFYLPSMILYHFVTACCSSPGVVLTTDTPSKWTARAGHGGWYGFDPVLDRQAEQKRLAMYGTLKDVEDEPKAVSKSSGKKDIQQTTTIPWLYPSPYASFCGKCNALRPPRAHHCGSSNRCVLQYDHFCVWLNNSIGYNNYRSFFLLLFYIMITCWYGVYMLFFPFYEPLQAQIREHGWRWLYSNGTGFLDLPPVLELIRMMMHGNVPSKIVIDIMYPLLLGVGAIMSGFFGYHVKYVCKGVTTLEHRVLLEHSLIALFRADSSAKQPTVVVNPFEQGWFRNLKQILGPNLWLVLMPVAVSIPPPYLPAGNKEKQR